MDKGNGGDWKRLYDSLAEYVKKLEEKLSKQTATLVAVTSNLINSQTALDVNKHIMRTALEDYNRKEQEYIAVVNALKAKLKELGHGDFSDLGN